MQKLKFGGDEDYSSSVSRNGVPGKDGVEFNKIQGMGSSQKLVPGYT